MMLPEDVEYVDDHPEWNGLSVTEELRVANERIAALEAQLEAQAIVANAYFDELQPWREMSRQLEALRQMSIVIRIGVNFLGEITCVLVAAGFDMDTLAKGSGDTLPAAVAAAYGKVVGDV